MPDPSVEPVLGGSATAAVAGGVARVLMALQFGECRWLALMIEDINLLAGGVESTLIPGHDPMDL